MFLCCLQRPEQQWKQGIVQGHQISAFLCHYNDLSFPL